MKLMAHALEPDAEKNYQAIIESPAEMVNLDRADRMLRMLASINRDEPLRSTFVFHGEKREYFVRLPIGFDPTQTHWPLITVHGGGGNGKNHFLAKAIRQKADLSGLDAIVVSPSFSNTDFQASRFPALGEGRFLIRVIEQLNREYQLHSKILLTGYSRGGQFSHRFAFAHPDKVRAVAPFAAGTWTTPGGALLIESLESVKDPAAYLSNPANAAAAPERLEGIFTTRVAKVAGLRPVPDAQQVPFLVMCGTLDPRIDISREFALSLIKAGFEVEAGWPGTPHGSRDLLEYKDEFKKYSQRAIEFFLRTVND